MVQRFRRGFKVFQYIQHQNQIILLSRLKTCVEWRDTNSVAVGAVWIDKVCRRLHTFHISEFAKPFEEKPVSAPDI